MKITVIKKAVAECGTEVANPGQTLEYVGHVSGGMVKVKCGEKTWVLHPKCFKEFQ